MTGLQILGSGHGLPKRCVTNEDMAQIVDTNNEWIITRTGIEQRYFCSEDETCGQLAAQAAQQALQQANLSADQIGLIVAATFTSDYLTPSLACQVHQALGCTKPIPCMDVNAACTGFLYGLETARSLLMSGSANSEYALVIGAEGLSRVLDFTDRTSCVLFGDAAAAMVVRLADVPYSCILNASGDTSSLFANSLLPNQSRFLQMDGKAIFRFAVDIIPKCLEQLLQKSGLTLEQIDHVVCHQANSRIIDHVVKKLGAPPTMFYKNMQRFGNTSAASIPLALDELLQNGTIRPGQKVVCIGFGAGLTWGACLLSF